MYGPTAEDHLKRPRNLGRLEAADGVGQVEDAATDTLLTIYVQLAGTPDGGRVVSKARFRAFGCGGCIITGSVITELARGRLVQEAASIEAATIHRALGDGLPAEQRYCADLAVRALRLAITSAA